MNPIIGIDIASGKDKTCWVLVRKFYNNTKVLGVYDSLEDAQAAHRKLAVDGVVVGHKDLRPVTVDRVEINRPKDDADIVEYSHEHYVTRTKRHK